MGKISSFIMGIVFVGLIMTGFALYISDVTKNYSTQYDNSTFEIYDSYSDLKTQTEEMKETVYSESSNSTFISSAVDLIGDFFKSGYTALKVSKSSMDTFQGMTSASVEKLDMGKGGIVLKNYILVLFTIFIVFAIISVLVNKDV